MSIELTQDSGTLFNKILYGNMTPSMAAEYLRSEKVSVRSFSEILAAMYPGDDILKRLTDFYLIAEPDSNLMSLNKKLRNWISGRHLPSDREDVFRIAFALRLTESDLDRLLSVCADYGIHYRDGREMFLTWFLRNGYGYNEAVEAYESMPGADDTSCLTEWRGKNITGELHAGMAEAQSLEELKNMYIENIGNFGKLHLRSYYYFEKFFSQLIHPTPVFGDSEPDYSIDSVMEKYLALSVPTGRKRTNYSLVQKLIKNNWPNSTSIKNIRNHVEDVPRKLLLLLYVVTENCILSDTYKESDEEYVTLEERMQDHWWTINAMLSDCGMALLDPRNAFDWLILYAIAADPDEAMSDRLEQVLSELYGDVRL